MATQENKFYMRSVVYGLNGDLNAWRVMVALNKRQTKREKVGTRTIDVNKRGFSSASSVLCDYAAMIERREISFVGRNAIDARTLDNLKTHLIVRYGGQLRAMVARGEIVLCSDTVATPATIKRIALNEARYKAAIDAADMVESDD
jgi:hypothetical protein